MHTVFGEVIDGTDFYETVTEMGEEITFLTDPEIKQYASIAPHRTTNTTDGAYWYRGVMTFDNVEQQNTLLGEYFIRQTNSVPKNILTSVMTENTTPRIGTTYSVECNEVVDIISHYEKTGEKTEFGEDIYEPVYLAKEIDCYMTMVLERVWRDTVGSFVNAVTNLTIPAKYTLSTGNIVVKKGFVFDKSTNTNKYIDIKYRVESIDTSMMDVIYEEVEVESNPPEEPSIETLGEGEIEGKANEGEEPPTEKPSELEEPPKETIIVERYVGILRCMLTEDKR